MKSNITKKNLPIANLSNQLAFNLSWNLSHREWNVVLYLISKLDSKNQKTFEEQVVSVKEIEAALKTDNKKWGGLYQELEKLRKSLMRKPIDFYTDVMVEGKPLTGGVNFFEMIIPERGADNSVNLRFKFTGSVKPLLLELNRQFVSIPQHKTKLMKSGHAIRFLIAAKAQRDSDRHFKKSVSSLRYKLNDFKMLLGIPDDSYSDLRNLKRIVINKIKKEINEKCDFLEIQNILYHPEKGKPKTEVEFILVDRNGGVPQQMAFLQNEDWQPSSDDIAALSRSKLAAHNILVEYGVTAGISFKQLLPKLESSSEFIGFEDWYVEELLRIFKQKTNKKKQDQAGRVGAFVNWLLNTPFTKNQFSEIVERIIARKKDYQKNEPEKWDNRQSAKNMTAKAFNNQYRETQKSMSMNALFKKS